MSPSQQERVFHKAYARELLRIARQDWETARFLLEGWDRIRTENFFFTVQQSLEKTIKAVLVSLELPVPLVHDLGILLAKVPASQEPPFGYEIGALGIGTTGLTVGRRRPHSSSLSSDTVLRDLSILRVLTPASSRVLVASCSFLRVLSSSSPNRPNSCLTAPSSCQTSPERF